jgi:hypothetical protein
MSTTAPEYLTTIRDSWAQAMQQWVDQSTSAWDQSTSAWDQWSQAWVGAVPQMLGVPVGAVGAVAAPTRGPGHHHHRHGHDEKDCGCGDRGRATADRHGKEHRHDHDCGCCGDACDCCVPEADVIVRARAGELRVVPFRLSNRWRREREVTLAVGPWQVCGGGALEVTGVLEAEKLVLAPCEDRVVRLLVSVRGTATTPTDPTSDPATEKAADKAAEKAAKAGDATVVTTTMTPGGQTVDVDECVSAYADVRFEGCGRPLRVAVVVSPAECDPVDVCCDCGCCC